jgi:hypothetical protein
VQNILGDGHCCHFASSHHLRGSTVDLQPT